MPSLSFDSMAALYEATRTVDGASLDSALDFLVERFPPSRFGRVLDPGIGTGRIAIPLAAHGYRVTGVDISEEMLSYLAKRLAEEPRSIAVDFHRGDVTRLAFPDATFDMALVVHLFYFIADWRRAADEIARTVRPGGAIVLMHTGTGMEVPALNEHYVQFCAERGCPIRPVGVANTQEVLDYYAGRGLSAELVRGRWQWTARIRLDEALGHMRARAYSFTTIAPDDVHNAAMLALEEAAVSEHGALTASVEVANEVRMAVIHVGQVIRNNGL